MKEKNIYELDNKDFSEYIEKLKKKDSKKAIEEIYNYTSYQIRPAILSNLNVIFGGRGTGKTFTMLKNLILNDVFFIWLRYTETTIEKIAKGQSLTRPISLSVENFPDIKIISDNGTYKFVEMSDDEKTIKKCFGYLMSLSTFKNARGVDFSNVKAIVIDEFIDEKGAKNIKYLGDLVKNMYETVNRNRELQGEKPVQITLLSNTNNIISDILEAFNLNVILEKMLNNNNKIYKTDDIYIRFIDNKAFTNEKKKTFLYRLLKDDEYTKMALENKFSYSTGLIRKNLNLKKAVPLFNINSKYVVLQLQNEHMYIKRGFYKDLLNHDLSNLNEKLLFKQMFLKQFSLLYMKGFLLFDSVYTENFIKENLLK